VEFEAPTGDYFENRTLVFGWSYGSTNQGIIRTNRDLVTNTVRLPPVAFPAVRRLPLPVSPRIETWSSDCQPLRVGVCDSPLIDSAAETGHGPFQVLRRSSILDEKAEEALCMQLMQQEITPALRPAELTTEGPAAFQRRNVRGRRRLDGPSFRSSIQTSHRSGPCRAALEIHFRPAVPSKRGINSLAKCTHLAIRQKKSPSAPICHLSYVGSDVRAGRGLGPYSACFHNRAARRHSSPARGTTARPLAMAQ